MKGIKTRLTTTPPVWVDSGTQSVRFTSDGKMIIVV